MQLPPRLGDWLHWLLTELVGKAERKQREVGKPRVILGDGTSLGETGGTGDDWRVQLAYDLVAGRLVHVQIGDRRQAETLVGLPGQPGDLFVGDRNYGKRDNLVAMDALQAATLQEEEGQALLRQLIGELEAGQESLIHAYLPLLEQWEAGEIEEETASTPLPTVSLWAVLVSCTTRWRAVVLGQWSLARVQWCLPRLRRFFCPSPRRRLHHRLGFQAWVQQRLLGTHLQGGFL